MYGQPPPFNNFLFQPPNNIFPIIFPNFPFQNPNFLPQNFPIPNPNYNPNNDDDESSRGRLLNETIQKIDKAVAKARREIVAAGEHVSAVKVLEAAIVILEVDSWESLGGIQMQHVPSLYRLMRLQGKVNAFINCFVEVWKITTLYDLETEICKNEGVAQFEELELGPLIRHPLIIRYFSVSSDSTGVFRISGEEVVKLLVKFTNTRKGKKKVKVDAFLEFIAKKRSVDSKEKLHVRIQSLRLHSALISKASPLEIAKLKKYLLGVGDKPKKVLHFSSKCQSKYSSPNMKSSDQVTSCLRPYPSATDEKNQLGVLSGKGDGTCIEGVVKSIRKRKLDAIDCKSFSSCKVLKRDGVGQASVGNNNISSKFNLKHKHEVDMSLDPDSLMTFITSWKDACKKAKDSKVVAREAIYYGPVDSSFKTSLVSWALPYAQRYIYNIHPNAYFELRRSGLNDLRIVEVEKLFYRDVIKKKKLGVEYDKPCECSCLLQDNILYATRESDTHPLFMELSRFLLAGVPDLHLANFLHMITTMAESGSTEEQKEFFMTNSQKLLNLPVEESLWSLASLPSLEENTDIPTTSSGFTLDDFISPKSAAKKLGNTKTKPFNTAKTRRDVTEGLIENDGDWIVQENSTSTIASVSLEEEALEDGVESGIGMDVGFKGQLDYGKIIVSSNSIERDQLSQGTDIPPHIITGRTGEFVAFKYFSAKFGEKRVIWVNEVKESGLPYDIVVEGKDNSNEYIEVKATSNARKVWFGISVREWQFAVEKGDSFSIARVVISDGKSAQITTHRNPAKLCQSRDLQLAIVSLKR